MKAAYSIAMVVIIGLVLSQGSLAIECSLDVYDLKVEGGETSARVKNTGEIVQNVSFEFLVDGSEISSGTFTLQPGESRIVENFYNFPAGESEVTFNAWSVCARDSETIWHTVLEGYSCSNPPGMEGQNYCDYIEREYLVCENGSWKSLGSESYYINCPGACGDGTLDCREGYRAEYSCSGDFLMQKYVDSDCRERFVTREICNYGCEAGVCLPEGKSCGVEIRSLEFTDDLTDQEKGHVLVEVESNRKGTLKFMFFLDGLGRGEERVNSSSGSVSRTFYFTAQEGTHTGEVRVSHSCGAEDSVTFRYHVQAGERVIRFDPPEAPEEVVETLVEIGPPTIDVPVFEGKALGIDIVSSRPQNFRVRVQNLPQGFATFEENVFVQGSGKAFIYLTPTSAGTHHFTVSVTAEQEGRTFSRDMRMFAVPSKGQAAITGLDVLPLAVSIVAILVVLGVIIAFVRYRGNSYVDYLTRKEYY